MHKRIASFAKMTAAATDIAHYRVGVIGAGIAGLTVANELVASQKLRVDELCVLEAQPRIGGRVQTRHFSVDVPVNIEVGAAWIHGTRGNPFTDLAAKFGLSLKEISARNPWLHPASCQNFQLFENDTRLSDDAVQVTWQWYELLLVKLQQLANGSASAAITSADKEKSLAELVELLATQDDELRSAIESCDNGRARLDFCVRLVEIWMGATAEALQLDDFHEIDLIGCVDVRASTANHSIVPARSVVECSLLLLLFVAMTLVRTALCRKEWNASSTTWLHRSKTRFRPIHA